MSYQPIHEMFRAAAGQFPNRVALECGDRTVKYRELEERSNRLANYLARCGGAPGAVVGIFAESLPEIAVAMLASLEAGCIFVILNPALPPARLAAMVARVAPVWLLLEAKLAGRLPELGALAGARRLCLDPQRAGAAGLAALGPDAEALPRLADASPAASACDPDAACYVYFTSGSSGQPKGIVGRLCGIDHFVRWEIDAFGLDGGPRVSQLTSPSFDAFLRDLFVPLATGGTSCQPDRATMLDGRRLADWLDISEVELVHCVPSLFRSLLASAPDRRYFAPLRHVLLSGEPLLPADVGSWCEVFGDRVQLVNLYGPTETTMTKFCYRVRPEDRLGRSVPIGKPIPGARAVLVDRAGRAVPPGAIGEIYIRTPYRTLGYWQDPEQTAKAFVKNPFSEDAADVVYRTGDLARVRDDGDFEFLGRADQQVKIRGVRVELAEIESHLRRHPAVEDVAVIDRDDATGTKYLCAFLVTREPVAAAELKALLLSSLPDYMVPSVFARMAELPRTITGKIDRQALPAATESGLDGRPFVAPRSRTEVGLAAIWMLLLGLPRVSLEQSFFELGGHSLLATQLLSRIRGAFQVELPLRALFDAPTLEGVAASIDRAVTGERGAASPPLLPVPRDQPLPLSFSQERLWFLDRLQPGNPAFNVPQVVRIRGALDVGRFQASLELLCRRHESLRTSLPAIDGKPVQRIAPARRIDIPLLDLASLPDGRRDELAWRFAGEQVRLPFDLARGPLLRVRLLRLEPADHLLVLVFHHVVSDEWSNSILTREWAALYSSLVTGEPAGLPELPVQVADHAHWQRQWMSGRHLEQELAYWTAQLGDDLAVLDLPTDRPRPKVAVFAGGGVALTMPAPLTERVLAVCHAEGLTLFMVLMAAYQLLLSRYARQHQVVVGTPVAGRDRTEIEGLIGCFVNTLVIRTDLGGDPTFRELLRRVRQVTLDALEHQEVPFEKLVEALQPKRSLSYDAPLFQVVFALQNAPSERLEVAGLTFEAPYLDTGAAKTDLDLDVLDTGEGLFAGLSYSQALFDATTVRRLLGHLQLVLDHGAADPERRLSQLALVSEGELHQLLYEWNDTATATPAAAGAAASLHGRFAAQAGRHPSRPAAVCGGDQISYAELDGRANQLARHLRGLGVESDTIVGLCAGRSLDLLVGLLGILKAGGAFLPLDPSYPMERLSFILRDAQVAVLVTQETLAESLPAHWGMTVYLDRERSLIARHETAPLPASSTPESAAYVIYTSGSTGRPKGVVVPHRGLSSLAAAQQATFGVAAGDRVLQFSSASFDASVFEIAMALGAGATLCLGSRDELLPGGPLQHFLEQRQVTAVTLPPSALEATPWRELPALATITVAGEACPRELVETWAPGRRFFNLYGPTEATIWSSVQRCVAGGGEPTLGRPVAGVRLLVMDRDLNPVAAGIPGELMIGGLGVSRGYLGQPALTAEKFIPDACGGEAGERLYRSGDLARFLAGGELQFLGRLDHQVKVRGFRVETREVEAALAEHPAVAEVVVVARRTGADRRLVAYAVLHAGAALDPQELRQAVAERLPEYMVPSAVVLLDRLPQLPSGKVDRAALPAPELAGRDLRRVARLPSTPVEEVLAGIWREVLEVAEVALDDSFFDLGGYSLAATQVLSRVNETFHLDYPLGQFLAGTLGDLAGGVVAALRHGERTAATPIAALPRDQEVFPLSLAQRQIWNLHDRSPGGAVDHVPAAFQLDGILDRGALAAALTEVVRRHEPLRTTFPVRDGERVQRIHVPAPVELPVIDLTQADPDLRQGMVRRLIDDAVQRPFDLDRGPLLRSLLLALADDQHVLVLVCHHLVIDQWSAGIFTREMSQLYGAFAAGESPRLPELAIQFVDFAAWQRQALSGEALAAQLAYWQRQLRGAQPLALPSRAPVAAGAGTSAVTAFALSRPTSEALRGLGRQRRVTVFMVFLAAFKALLAEITGQHDIVVRTPIANRTRPEIEPLIGFFPNELVLRTDLAGDPSYLELLDRVRDVTVEAYVHQDVPFEAVVEAMGDEMTDADDLMRVTCNYYNAPMSALALRGLRLIPLEVGTGLMHRHLMLLLTDGSEGFECAFQYRDDLLAPGFVEMLAARFRKLLEAVAEDPWRTLSELLRDRPRGDLPPADAGRQTAEPALVAL
jgi:amino acid adenylation domain-containing protein